MSQYSLRLPHSLFFPAPSFPPAHAVLVDFLPPMDGEVVSVIQEALSQVLTLAHHLKGTCRMSYFNLIALGTFPEVQQF